MRRKPVEKFSYQGVIKFSSDLSSLKSRPFAKVTEAQDWCWSVAMTNETKHIEAVYTRRITTRSRIK